MLNIRAVHLCSFSLFFFGTGSYKTRLACDWAFTCSDAGESNLYTSWHPITSVRRQAWRKTRAAAARWGAVVADLADDEQQRRVEQGEHARRGSVAVE